MFPITEMQSSNILEEINAKGPANKKSLAKKTPGKLLPEKKVAKRGKSVKRAPKNIYLLTKKKHSGMKKVQKDKKNT